MKTIMTLLLLTILIIGFNNAVMAQVPSYVPTNGLVGWWPFNGNANDLSGNGNNGTVNGAILSNDRYGNSNSAYSFDGINDYIMISNSLLSSTNPQSFTINVWLKINNSKWNDIITDRSGSNCGYNYRLMTTPLNKFVLNRFIQSPWTVDSISATGISNVWIMVTAIYDNSSSLMKLYTNGTLTSTKNSTLWFNQTNPTIIGSLDGCNLPKDNFFNGMIDDLGFWSRALTQQEITELHNSKTMSPVFITPSGATTFCQGGNVVLNSSLMGSSYTYQWLKDGNSISNATSATYTATQSGSYTLRVDSADFSTISTNSIVVTANPLPNVSIYLAPYINYETASLPLTGNPSGGTFSGAGVSGATFYPASAGLGAKQIRYVYTDGNNCTNFANGSTLVYDTIKCLVSATDTLIINANLTGVNPPGNVNTIKVYPNPANDQITIHNGDYAKMSGYTIKIENSKGQNVFTQVISKQEYVIDLNTWTGKGIYFLHLIDANNNTIEIKKIVLQ